MPCVDAFVTNGGYGSLLAALAHEVPIVVAADTEDKVETAARVSWSGVSINLRTDRPTPASALGGHGGRRSSPVDDSVTTEDLEEADQ